MSGIITVKGQYILPKKLLKLSDKKKLKKIIPYTDNDIFIPKTFSIYNEIKIPKRGEFVILPRSFGINKYGIRKNYIKDGIDVSFPSLSNKYKPKDYQQNAIDSIIKDYKKGNLGGLLNMSPGSGKTFTALCIMLHIGKKTLIVTDKERSDQFKSEIFKFIPGIKNEEIGVLQESKDGSILRDDNVKIIISVNNTISNGKFPTKEYVDIGFVILDEIDSYISKKRIRIFNYISSRYLMGMSATLTKPNKLGFLINWYIGDVKYKYMKAYNGKNIFVRRIIYNSDNESVYNERGGIDPTNTYKVVMNDIKRETIILKLIAYYYIGKIGIKTFPMIGSKNGKIIIIGLYREQLERLYKRIINELGLTTKEVGIYYGAKTKKERNELKRVVKECKIVLAIRSMAYKGLNIPESDVMIMASSYIPKNKGKNTESLSQLIGRITRKDHIINPILVDIIDNFGFFKKHGKLRYKYYKEKKYLIETEKVNIIGNKS